MKDTFEKVSTLQKVPETLENWYISAKYIVYGQRDKKFWENLQAYFP